MLTPYLAQVFSSRGVMVVRAVQGVCQGFVFPLVHCLLSKWVPMSERSRFSTFVYSGNEMQKNLNLKIFLIIIMQFTRYSSWYSGLNVNKWSFSLKLVWLANNILPFRFARTCVVFYFHLFGIQCSGRS